MSTQRTASPSSGTRGNSQAVSKSQQGKKNNFKTPAQRLPLTDEMLEKLVIKAVVLFFAAVLVYIPAMNGGYIYDDDTLLYNNAALRQAGRGWDAAAWHGLWSFWFPVGADANVAADYAPLADTTFWIEWRLWGNNKDNTNAVEADPKVKGIGSTGYHCTNIILHGIAALLLWYVLAEIGIPGAWLAALVWAVHPICAESVAWIAERRNPLSMIMFMLTMIYWFKFQRTGRSSVYWLSVGLFVLTMLSKTSIVMLPVLLLLSIWWDRGWKEKLNWGQVREAAFFAGAVTVFMAWCLSFVGLLLWANGYVPWLGSDLAGSLGVVLEMGLTALAIYAVNVFARNFGPAWRQVLPFFMVSVIFGILTIYFQNFRAIAREYVPGYIDDPLKRIPAACFALGFYFYKIFCPSHLNLIYEQWHRILPFVSKDMSVAQVIHNLNNKVDMRYTFMGFFKQMIIGVDFAAVFLWAWFRRATWGRHVIFGLGMFVIMIFPVLGFTRMAYMRLTLVSDHFQYAPMVGVIVLTVAGLVYFYNMLQPSVKPLMIGIGAGLIMMFCALTWQRAIVFSDPVNLWQDNIKNNPESWQGHSHMGALYWGTSAGFNHNVDAALDEWKKSVDFAPYLYETHNNYALALNEKGAQYEARGDIPTKQKYMDDALAEFNTAVTIEPQQPRVRANYAGALMNAGDFEMKINQPASANGYYNQSIDQFLKVIQIYQGDPGIYFSLGMAYLKTNQLDNSLTCLTHAQELFEAYTRQKNPDYENAIHLIHLYMQKQRESDTSGSSQTPVTVLAAQGGSSAPAPAPASSPNK